jgi:hypothetical protein
MSQASQVAPSSSASMADQMAARSRALMTLRYVVLRRGSNNLLLRRSLLRSPVPSSFRTRYGATLRTSRFTVRISLARGPGWESEASDPHPTVGQESPAENTLQPL